MGTQTLVFVNNFLSLEVQKMLLFFIVLLQLPIFVSK